VAVKFDCWVFECRKCGHLIFLNKNKTLKKLETYKCPECKEKSERNWIFLGEGSSENFDWK